MRLPGVFSTPAFRQGFRAAIPLWLAAAPVALAYVLAAHRAGISDLEIQLMSLVIYSAAAQIAIAQLLAGGASELTILFTVLVMNVHYIIYGLSLIKHIRFTRSEKAAAAFALTDAAYGLTIAVKSNRTIHFLLGAELSMFLAWNVSTAFALLVGDSFTAIRAVPLEFIVPLTFIILLVGMIKTPSDLTVVLCSATLAVLFTWVGVGELTLVITTIGGSLLGVGLTKRSTS